MDFWDLFSTLLFSYKKEKMGLMIPEAIPFYVFLSTLMVHGSAGLDLPYLLLALVYEKSGDYENEDYTNISDNMKPDYANY